VGEPLYSLGPVGESETARNDLEWVREYVRQSCVLVNTQGRLFPGQMGLGEDRPARTLAEFQGIFRNYEQIQRYGLDEMR
jgi:hypothetical protein